MKRSDYGYTDYGIMGRREYNPDEAERMEPVVIELMRQAKYIGYLEGQRDMAAESINKAEERATKAETNYNYERGRADRAEKALEELREQTTEDSAAIEGQRGK